MKKISLFVFSSLLTAFGFAQETKFGVKGGLNISTFSNGLGQQRGSRLGFHGGFLAHIHLSQQWALQPEIVYSSEGTKYTISNGEHSLALNYINIPLQLQYMFANGFRIQTGPQVGFLASVKDKLNGNETKFFTTQDFKSIDFAWSVGLGYLTYSGFGVDGRYNFGISNANNSGSTIIHNNVFQLGVFYLFDHNHKGHSH